jgi:hypothetical protein
MFHDGSFDLEILQAKIYVCRITTWMTFFRCAKYHLPFTQTGFALKSLSHDHQIISAIPARHRRFVASSRNPHSPSPP